MSAAATNGEAKDSAQKNGHHKKGGDQHSEGSELSETSDIEPLDDDDEDGLKIGSDEEEKQQHID